MRKIILIFLSISTLTSFIFLCLGVFNYSEWFSTYKIFFGIVFLTTGGFLRQHSLRNNKHPQNIAEPYYSNKESIEPGLDAVEDASNFVIPQKELLPEQSEPKTEDEKNGIRKF